MPEGLPTKRTRRSCARTDVPLPWLSINAHVEARYRGSIRWSSGTILNRDIDDGDNPVYDVLFRDGCRDRKVPARNIRIHEGGGAVTGEGSKTDKLNTAVAHTQAPQLAERNRTESKIGNQKKQFARGNRTAGRDRTGQRKHTKGRTPPGDAPENGNKPTDSTSFVCGSICFSKLQQYPYWPSYVQTMVTNDRTVYPFKTTTTRFIQRVFNGIEGICCQLIVRLCATPRTGLGTLECLPLTNIRAKEQVTASAWWK